MSCTSGLMRDLINIKEASHFLKSGDVVAIPTETVYGLAADATNAQAVAKIYEVKNRPSFNPLIIHVATLEDARSLIDFTPDALKLARAFWPGALTIVGKKVTDCPVCDLASAGLDTLGVRIPAHPVAQTLLQAVERPLAAPSANPSGKLSPTTAQHVADALNVPVLDGGACPVGVESTIVMCTDGVALLREGGISREEIEKCIGKISATPISNTIHAPGQCNSHYAPNAPLRLNATAPYDDEVWLGFGSQYDFEGLNLSVSGNLSEAAANLFSMLRHLDGDKVIAVCSIPEIGIGRAINDRLRRAAAPRPTQRNNPNTAQEQ